jgi:hypothetical protein
MENAESEPVKLKAATEILDRAGVRGGIEVDTSVNIDVRPAASIIAERLQRLTATAAEASAKLSIATGEELPQALRARAETVMAARTRYKRGDLVTQRP